MRHLTDPEHPNLSLEQLKPLGKANTADTCVVGLFVSTFQNLPFCASQLFRCFCISQKRQIDPVYSHTYMYIHMFTKASSYQLCERICASCKPIG